MTEGRAVFTLNPIKPWADITQKYDLDDVTSVEDIIVQTFLLSHLYSNSTESDIIIY